VPRSSKLVEEDGEYSLFSVVLFRRVADSFKANARTRGFQVSLPISSCVLTEVTSCARHDQHPGSLCCVLLETIVCASRVLRSCDCPTGLRAESVSVSTAPQADPILTGRHLHRLSECVRSVHQVREHELDEEKAEADANNSNALADELSERRRTLEQWSVAAYGEVRTL